MLISTYILTIPLSGDAAPAKSAEWARSRLRMRLTRETVLLDDSKGERHRSEGVSLDRGRGVEQQREGHGVLRVTSQCARAEFPGCVREVKFCKDIRRPRAIRRVDELQLGDHALADCSSCFTPGARRSNAPAHPGRQLGEAVRIWVAPRRMDFLSE